MKNIQLIESLEQNRDELQKSIEPVITAINALNAAISALRVDTPYGGNNKGVNKASNNDYDPKASLPSKIIYFIKQEQRFLHNREIAQLAHAYEPNVSVNDFKAKFSPVLSSLKRDKKVLTNIVIGKSNVNTFWGVAKWLDEDGKILPDYKFREDQLQGNLEKEPIDI